MVEHDLAKVGVASSNLVSRSKRPLKKGFVVFGNFESLITLENAGMVEQVDTQDLKSCESNLVRVRFPLLVQASLFSGAFLFTFSICLKYHQIFVCYFNNSIIFGMNSNGLFKKKLQDFPEGQK